MNKFFNCLLLLFVWIVLRIGAPPPDRLFFIEFNRDALKGVQQQQDEDQKSTNEIISAKAPQQFTLYNASDAKHDGRQQQQQQQPQQQQQQQQEMVEGPLSVSVKIENQTAFGNEFSINFTDISYMLVCRAKFHVIVPSHSSVANYWNIDPVPGAVDQFTFPKDVRLYPGHSYNAGVLLDGKGQPEVEILDTLTVLTTEKCPNDPYA